MLLAINEVLATVTPIQVPIIIKYIGNDLLKADKASGEILPAKKVSTTSVSYTHLRAHET